MPFYSFDPQDEGEDWEAELLEEGLTHRPNPANKVSQHILPCPYERARPAAKEENDGSTNCVYMFHYFVIVFEDNMLKMK